MYTSKGLWPQVTQEVISDFFSLRQTFILKPVIRYKMFSLPQRHLKIHTSIPSPRSFWRSAVSAKTFSDHHYCNQKKQYSSSCRPTNYCIIWTFLGIRACLRWYMRSGRSFVQKERIKNIFKLGLERQRNEWIPATSFFLLIRLMKDSDLFTSSMRGAGFHTTVYFIHQWIVTTFL